MIGRPQLPSRQCDAVVLRSRRVVDCSSVAAHLASDFERQTASLPVAEFRVFGVGGRLRRRRHGPQRRRPRARVLRRRAARRRRQPLAGVRRPTVRFADVVGTPTLLTRSRRLGGRLRRGLARAFCLMACLRGQIQRRLRHAAGAGLLDESPQRQTCFFRRARFLLAGQRAVRAGRDDVSCRVLTLPGSVVISALRQVAVRWLREQDRRRRTAAETRCWSVVCLADVVAPPAPA